jgi:hypothetical protein
VAFSDGSLLHGFNRRLEKRQPLSAPNDVRRFFISHEEAAQLCLLAFALGDRNEIFHPKMNPSDDLKSFSDIACMYLQGRGLEPVLCASDAEAREWFARNESSTKQWPCFFSSSNTSGEKLYEEFVGDDEGADIGRFATVGVVSRPARVSKGVVAAALQRLAEVAAKPAWEKAELVKILESVVPELRHLETFRSLDQKM